MTKCLKTNKRKDLVTNMENQEIQKNSGSKKKLTVIIACVAVAVIAVILFFVGRSLGKKELSTVKKDAIITVGDYGYALEDMMYYIYTEEEAGALYNEIYQTFYGDSYSYWDEEDEENDNMTGQEASKKNILNAIKKELVWYQEALKAGYTLTEDDKSTAKDAYDSFLENLTEKQKAEKGMGEELLSYFEKQQVIQHYKDDLLEEAGFDTESIAATVSKEEYREYKYEYYCIYKEDEEGNKYSKKELTAHLNSLKELASKVEPDTDMESLLTQELLEYMEYGNDSLVERDGEGYGTYKKVDVDALIKGMENGKVSDAVETEFAYYIFRMDDNNSEEAYEERVEELVSKEETKIYNASYKNAKANYKITVDKDKWNKVTLGSIIYGMDESTNIEGTEESTVSGWDSTISDTEEALQE